MNLNLELQQNLRRVMHLGDMTQGQVARGASVSTAIVSQFLNSTPENVLYKGDMARIQKRLGQFCAREMGRLAAPKPPEYVETENSAQILSALRLADIERTICVVVGPPGSGKTFTLKRYADDIGDALFITANPAWRIKALICAICAPLGIHANLPAYSLVERAVETLHGTGRILIIDEAQSLSYEALEVVRAIHDRAHIGVVLSGMRKLHDNMVGRGRGLYAHLYSRVSRDIDLSAEIEVSDVEKLVLQVFPNATQQEVKLFAHVANQGGRLRTLVQTLCHLRRTADLTSEPLSEQMINETRRVLMVVS